MRRLLTGSILAHEVMHAWLRLSGYPRLPPMVEEGLCQLMATLWLEQQPAEPEVSCKSLHCMADHRVHLSARWRCSTCEPCASLRLVLWTKLEMGCTAAVS